MNSLQNPSDDELIKQYLGGDEFAFNKIISNNLTVVYSVVYYLIGNKSDVEDVVQETFVKLWKNIKKYKQGQSFRSWLLTITRNTALDFLRKKKLLVFSDFENESGDNLFVDNLTDDEPLSDEVFSRQENKKILEEIIEKLPLPQREVVILRYSSNLTFEEIGKIVNRPLHTVKSQHRRALLEIKKQIDF